MPQIIMGNENASIGDWGQVLADINLDYTYPEGMDLHPKSKLSRRIVSEVLSRARESKTVMSGRYDSWNEIDKQLTAYIRADDNEKILKQKDERKPISIVFPYTYAVLETLLTYLVMALLQNPVFRYDGVGPEDYVGAKLLQLLIDRHVKRNKVELALHTWLRDSLAYGIGAVTTTWRVNEVRRDTTLGGRASKIIFEGNALRNVDPYKYLPDPTQSCDNTQDGSYVGFYDSRPITSLLSEEAEDQEGLVFNVRYLRHLKGKRSSIHSDESARNIKTLGAESTYQGASSAWHNLVDVIYMYINIIPKEWELGDGEYPEKWLFAVASDSVVIEARPADFNHNMYPIAAIAPDSDGYSAAPLSRVEILSGLQGHLDFLFNSHVTNIRKAINDMLIVDPYLINVNDLKEPEPGKLVRMRRTAWGRGLLDGAVKQLSIQDITAGHTADAAWIMQGMNHASGADESMMGGLRRGGPERLTSAEFQGTRGSALSRLERMSRMCAIQGFQDVATIFAHNAQQFTRREAYVQIAGQLEQDMMEELGSRVSQDRVQVRPEDLVIDYDVNVRDGSVPGPELAQVWVELFKIMSSSPEIGQQFDTVRIFKHIARNLGAKNVNDFVRQGGNIQPQLMQAEQIAQQAQAGNIVPIGAQG